jgi:hypothetical protein
MPYDRKSYDRGWRASQRYGRREYEGMASPMENADIRGEPDAWYDGYLDHATDRAKWHTARKHEREETA